MLLHIPIYSFSMPLSFLLYMFVSFVLLTHTVTLRPTVLDDPETDGGSSIVLVPTAAAIPVVLIIAVVIVAVMIIVCVRLVCECT